MISKIHGSFLRLQKKIVNYSRSMLS